MKKIFFFILILCSFTVAAQAQEAGKFRFGMEMGPAAPQGGDGLGFVFNLEPKINVKDNLNIGMRFSAAALAKNISLTTLIDEAEGEASGTVAVAGTLDYYLNKGNSSVAPFIGGGIGYYSMANMEVTADDNNLNFDNLEPSNAWGGLVRAGIELGKFRMAAEYNIVPDTDLQDSQGLVVGTTSNRYFAFTLGFYLGGGKWKK